MGGGVVNKRKHVLVVDDSRLNRAILSRILTSDGCETAEAENGRQALNILLDGTHKIDLVLLDIVMPVMDGYELLRRMDETGLLTAVPVIVTTGSDDEDAEICCLENGASDFLRKPYNAELVRHRVRSMLRLWDNAALINRLEIDRLTGAYSRESFYSRVEAAIESDHDGDYFIAYADIDDFKLINARYGMESGDELLRYVGGVLRGAVGDDGICGRIGADTFALLMTRRPELSQEEVGELLERDFAAAPVRGSRLKFGVYEITDRTLSATDMCDRAKLAMASIKHHYGVYYAVYDDSMRDRALREHQLAEDAESALEHKQLAVYLQPKHLTENGEVAGAEALVRWIHPELGFISPGEFIPLFERNGFISRLDKYMLNEVCRMLRRWIDNGIEPTPISVNISRVDFSASELTHMLERIVDVYRLPHGMIHFEVTESAYTDDPDQIIAAVSVLQQRGFLIEMDDFGSGYSSLNMLSELPIDIIKLDMRFLLSGNDSIEGGKRNILSFIFSLSKWLKLPTVAEGVEKKEEFDFLKAMGCTMIQGYYFAKPMPVNEFEDYLCKCREGK